MDITSAETKATYDEIKKYVAEHNAGMKVSNRYISQVKRKCGIEVGKNYNLPKNEDSRQPQCPEDKESAIVEPLSKKPPLQNQRFKWWEHVTNDQNGFPTVRSISFDFGLDIRKPPYSSLRAFYCTPHYREIHGKIRFWYCCF